MPSYLIAGDSSNGVQVTSSNDNALTIQTGPNGGKVNALSLSATGIPTFNQLAQSFGTNGYSTLPGGLIVQWGTATSSGAATGNGTITLATANINFPNAVYGAWASCTQAGANYHVESGAITTSSLPFTVLNAASGAATTAVTFNWIAIGR